MLSHYVDGPACGPGPSRVAVVIALAQTFRTDRLMIRDIVINASGHATDGIRNKYGGKVH